MSFAEGVAGLWKNGNQLVEKSGIEIIDWHSGYTIVKFKGKRLSNKWKDYFDKAIELEKYKLKNGNI